VRLLAVVVVALACAAVAAAGPRTDITQTAVSGLRLGMRAKAYYGTFGISPRLDRLEDGYRRLVFPQPRDPVLGGGEVELYFAGMRDAAVAIVVTDPRWRTLAQVGPCSTVTALRRAYGARLAPLRQGANVVAYHLGNLWFASGDGPRISAVQLSARGLGPWLALNAPTCKRP